MRSEVEARGTVMTTIFDVESQKMYMFDSKKKSADVWDMKAFSEGWARTSSPSGQGFGEGQRQEEGTWPARGGGL